MLCIKSFFNAFIHAFLSHSLKVSAYLYFSFWRGLWRAFMWLIKYASSVLKIIMIRCKPIRVYYSFFGYFFKYKFFLSISIPPNSHICRLQRPMLYFLRNTQDSSI
ncbi:hypothetical protein H311_02436 [Anncaliia algerae PRA109]|nr:hypothetical protein H311_02436 [Anncaliia algerae PRA109]